MFFASCLSFNSTWIRSLSLIIVLSCLWFSVSAAHGGKLSRTRSNVRKEREEKHEEDEDKDDDHGTLSKVRTQTRAKKSSSGGHRHGSQRSHHGHSNRHFFGHPVIALHVESNHGWRPVVNEPLPAPPPPTYEEEVTSPEIPAVISPSNFFSRYPYADGCDGFMTCEPSQQSHRTWTARTQFEYGNDFDDVSRWSANVLVQGSGGWGLDFNWNEYSETLDSGGSDELRVGDFNVIYRIVETEQVQWRAGIGFNWLSDSIGNDYGINYSLGMDLTPKRPWIISGKIDWGAIGDAKMLHGRVSVGAIWDRVEVFTGYDYRRIGSVPLHGPMAGVRIWF